MKTIWYIDSENIQYREWDCLFPSLEPGDEFLIFYTCNTASIPEHIFQSLESRYVKTGLISCYAGKNALDFQLISVLGWCIIACPECRHRIISRDKGYNPPMQFWIDKGYDVIRQYPAHPYSKTVYAELEKLGFSGQELDNTCRSIVTSLEHPSHQPLCDIHCRLVKIYGQQHGARLYRKVKSYLMQIRNKMTI